MPCIDSWIVVQDSKIYMNDLKTLDLASSEYQEEWKENLK